MKTGAGRAKQLLWQPVDRGARRACSTAPLPSASAAPLAGTVLAARDDKRPHHNSSLGVMLGNTLGPTPAFGRPAPQRIPAPAARRPDAHHPVSAPHPHLSGGADECPPTACVGACGDSAPHATTCAASGPARRALRAAGPHAWGQPLSCPAGPARGAPGCPRAGSRLQKVRIRRGPQFPALLRAVPRPRAPLPRPL